MLTEIQEVLNRIRPYLQADGGDVELVDFSGGMISLRFVGACARCSRSAMTLEHSIAPTLKKHLPDVSGVVRA